MEYFHHLSTFFIPFHVCHNALSWKIIVLPSKIYHVSKNTFLKYHCKIFRFFFSETISFTSSKRNYGWFAFILTRKCNFIISPQIALTLTYNLKAIKIKPSFMNLKLYVNTGKICGEMSLGAVKIKEDKSLFAVLCRLKIWLIKLFFLGKLI